jgi:Predicted transcriptional regulators
MFVDIYVLSQLIDGPKHGYEIKKDLEYFFGPYYTVNNSMLYPVLKKYEKQGAVVKHVEQQEGKPNRHVYRLTEDGKKTFYDMLKTFPPEIAANESEFCVRLFFFHLIDQQSRMEILQKRKDVLNQELEHIEKFARQRAERMQTRFYGMYYEYNRSCIQLELQMVDDLMGECTADRS